MKTRQMLQTELLAIDTHIPAGNGASVPMSQLSSFLANRHPLPSNQDMLAAAKKAQRSLSPKTVGGLDSAVDPMFPATDLSMPDAADYFNDTPANQNVMFLSLNIATRDGVVYDDWSMFHDMKQPTHTYYLYTITNDPMFHDAYITDVLKDHEDSNSGRVKTIYFAGVNRIPSILDWPSHRAYAIKHYTKPRSVGGPIAQTEEEAVALLEKYSAAFKRSATILNQELAIVQPKHLVVFGPDAKAVLLQMAPLLDVDPALIEQAVTIDHYGLETGMTVLAEHATTDLKAAITASSRKG